jgi:hypothetical protein
VVARRRPPQPVEAALVHLSGRKRRIDDDDAVEALHAQADRRLGDAHVGLTPDDDRCPPPGLLHSGEDLRRPREPERRLAQHRRPGGEALGEARVGRPVPLGLLLGHDDRDLEPGRQRDKPDRAIQRRTRGDGVLVREPFLREESGLHVHDHEDGVVSLEQAHAASLRVRLSDGRANREVGAFEADFEHVRDPA